MRDGWTETTLGDLCELYQPETISKAKMDDAAAYVVYGANGPVGRYSRFNHEEPEVVVTCRGATCGVVNMTPPNCWITGNAMVVKPRDNRSIKGFLFWALQTSVDVQATISGSAQPQITRTSLEPSKILVPPLEEQKRIVDMVSSVDAYIDALQQQAVSARKARNAVLHELLSFGGDDWTETTLGEISNFVSRRELPKSLALDTPYVGLEHVEPKTTLISSWGNVESVSSSVTPFEPEDTLFGRLRPYLHKVAFADFPGVCSPEILVLRSNAKCESKFLYLLCSLNSTIENCVDMSAGTRMPRTSTTDLASISVRLPPLNEQKQIVEIVSSMDAVIQSTEQAVTAAKNLRSGLLSDLLSGEHEIPASYDSFLGAA